MANVLNIYSRLTLDLRDFKARLGEAGTRMGALARQWEKTFRGLSRTMTSLGSDMALLGGIAGGALLVGFKRFADGAGEIADLSNELGIGAQALTEYQYLLGLSGIKFEEWVNAIRKQQRTLVEGTENDVLRKLGLDPETLKNLSPEVAFEELLGAISSVGNAAERTAYAMAFWGRSGSVINRLAKEGRTGIAAMRAEAAAMGVTLDDETASRLENFGDEVDKLLARLAVFGKVIYLQLLPTFESWLDKLRGLVRWVMEFRAQHEGLFSLITKVALGTLFFNAALGLLFLAFGRVFSVISTSFGLFKRLSALTWAQVQANLAAAGSFLAWTAAIALVAVAIGMIVSKSFRDYVRNLEVVRKVSDFFFVGLTTAWEQLKFGVTSAFDGIISHVKAAMQNLAAIVLYGVAAIVDKLNVLGIDKLTAISDSIKSAADEYTNAGTETMQGYRQRQGRRAYERDRNIEAAYDASIFGETGREQWEAQHAAKNAPASGGGGDDRLLKANEDQLVLLERIARAMDVQSRPGTSRMPVEVY